MLNDDGLLTKWIMWVILGGAIASIVVIPFHLHSMEMLEENQKELKRMKDTVDTLEEQHKLFLQRAPEAQDLSSCTTSERMNWVGITSERTIQCQ